MSWRLEIRPEVETDLAAATLWYEMQQPGLGARFLDEVETAWRRLEQNPLLSAVKTMGQGIRWCYPDHFPYRIVYHVNEKGRTVLILAVLHGARRDSETVRRAGKNPA